MNVSRPVLLTLCLVTAPAASAQQRPEPPKSAQQKPEPAKEELKESVSVTKHTIDVGRQPLRYTATAGTLVLKDDKDRPQASMFYVAYTRDDVADRARRPIFYSFNGGPGTASVWMHMGFTGPRRVVYDDEGMMLAPPFRLADNEHTILDVADIVYIDPVGTGYSRMAADEDRFTVAFYESGHMMYVRKADLAKAKQDIAQFVATALAKGTAAPARPTP